MKAAIYTRYGGPEVVSIAPVAQPTPKRDEILVRVGAAGVTTGDWRLRAAAFPGALMQIAGRLMFGMFRPRKRVLGGDFAGTVVQTGAGVTQFAPGDRVFGFSMHGAHAEFVTMSASGLVAPIPSGLTDSEAAALPFGSFAALGFLEQFGGLRAGERVMIVGASGGVGAYAVQIARALGAQVTAVASGGRAGMLRDLGAEAVIDYRAGGIVAQAQGQFDMVLDTVGALDYDAVQPILKPGGRFVPLNFGPRELRARRRARKAGHSIVIAVDTPNRATIDRIALMVNAGMVRPVIDTVLPFARIREAYARVEGRHRAGAVVLEMAAPDAETGQAAA